MPIYRYTFGYAETDIDLYNGAVKDLKEHLRVLNTHLQGEEFLVGSTLTVADIVVFSTLVIPFQVALDGGFRKAMQNVSNWFLKIAKVPEVVNRFGNIKPSEKVVKPPAAPKKVEKVEVKKEVTEVKKEQKEENPLDVLPPSKLDLYNFKTFFVNHEDKKGAGL